MAILNRYYTPIVYIDLETSTRWTIAYADLSDPPNRFTVVPDKDIVEYFDTNNLDFEKFLLDECLVYDQTTLKWESFRSFVDSFDNIDTVEKNNSVRISNLVYQDYVDNFYFVETQNWELTYVNTIGTNHTYTLNDHIEVYLNGVLQ